MKELYFLIFRKMSRNPKSRYFLFWFHINGSLSFVFSALKHFKRKNYNMVFVNVKFVFWQIWEAISACRRVGI